MDDLVDGLLHTRITDLSIATPQIRRALAKNGFVTFGDVIAADDASLDALIVRHQLSFDDADAISSIKAEYQKNPTAFAQNAVRSDAVNGLGLPSTDSVVQKASATIVRSSAKRTAGDAASRVVAVHASTLHGGVLPNIDAVKELRGFQARARESLDALAMHEDHYLVYEAFEDFPTDLDELDDCFIELFVHCRWEVRSLLRSIDEYLPEAFLLFVSDEARRLYDGDAFWEHFFKQVQVGDQNNQALFKRCFISCLEKRRMPTYGKNEDAFYYLYTALLHGGFSRAIWASIWKDSILPICSKSASSYDSHAGYLDGHMILSQMLKRDSPYAPSVSAQKILEKAPIDTLTSMFDSAVLVGQEAILAKNSSSALISNYGLSDTAMDALGDVSRAKTRSGEHSHSHASNRLTYLPMGKMELNLGTGGLRIRWKKVQLPLTLAGYRVDFYLGGTLVHSEPIEESVGKCVLESVDIEVGAFTRCSAEIKLMAPYTADEKEMFREEASASQSFEESESGCMEFVEGTANIFSLRTRKDRITRRKKIAYLLSAERQLVPGRGMKLIETRECRGDDSSRIEVYEVSPGAAGELTDRSNGEVVAAWQESYSVTIDKSHQIGVTADGRDLYCVTKSNAGGNLSLPMVMIDAADGKGAFHSLSVFLLCNGQRISVRQRLIDDEWGTSAQIDLLLQEALGLDVFAANCELTCRDRETNNTILKYRFAIVPISPIALSYVDLLQNKPSATYIFKTMEPLSIVYNGCTSVLVGGENFNICEPTEMPSVRMSFADSSGNHALAADIWLMGIEFHLPEQLKERVREQGSLCMADAMQLRNGNGEMTISAIGRRPGRRLLILAGSTPLAFRDLEHPGTHSFNLFSVPEVFLSENKPPEKFDILSSVCFGTKCSDRLLNPAWADALIAHCTQGFGFTRIAITIRDDACIAMLDAPSKCTLQVSFSAVLPNGQRKTFEGARLSKGSSEFAIPERLLRLAAQHCGVSIRMCPLSLFGKPREDCAMTISGDDLQYE